VAKFNKQQKKKGSTLHNAGLPKRSVELAKDNSNNQQNK